MAERARPSARRAWPSYNDRIEWRGDDGWPPTNSGSVSAPPTPAPGAPAPTPADAPRGSAPSAARGPVQPCPSA